MVRSADVAVAEGPAESEHVAGLAGVPSGEDTSPTEHAAADQSAVGAKGNPGTDDDLSLLRHVTRVGLIVIAALACSVALDLVAVSAVQHRAAQQAAFDKLRKQMAEGTAPVAPIDRTGRLLALGVPLALVDIPSIHVHQVVLEGTTGGVLMSGPGHRRDTSLPGQAGTSVIMGRAAAFGGPFKELHRLHIGATVTVTTGEGVSRFKVIDRRRAGDPTPPVPGPGKGRLQLVTAAGPPFLPSGVLRVDADLVTPTLGTPPQALSGVPHAEQPLGTDTATLWALVLWLQALVVVAVAVVWSWIRWGRLQTWIVFLPLTALIGVLASDQFIRLLPNLL